MTPRPPALRAFAVALSLCLMLILPVSAVEQIVLQDSEDTYFTYSLTKRRTVIDQNVYRKINIYDGSAVRSYDSLYVKAEVAPAGSGAEQTAHARIRERPSDYTNVTLKYNGAVVATANVGYNTFFANDGYTLKNIQWWLENIEWISIDSIPAGYVQLLVSDYSMDFALFGSYLYLICCTDAGPDAAKPVVFGDKYIPDYVFGDYVVSGTIRWQNTVEIDKNPDELFGYIRIIRDGYSSTVSISSDAGTYTDNSARNLNYRFIGPGNWTVNSSIGRSFAGTFGSDASIPTPTSDRVPVNIAAIDSRSGNLLLDAAVEVRDQNGTVVATGSTSPNGWLVFEYDLPATLTDEDFQRYYTVDVSLDGWTQKVPAMQFYPAFIPRSGDWIRVEMLPDSSGPADPGKTYLMFYVRDTAGNGLPGAYVNIDGEYWGTNNAGHVAVAVAKNATHPYTISKTGYMTLSGSATVADAPSYQINVVLGAGSVPTYTPTAGPGGPGATPTPDRRSNEEKGQAVIDMVADNAEGIGALALICLLMGLLKLMVKW